MNGKEQDVEHIYDMQNSEARSARVQHLTRRLRRDCILKVLAAVCTVVLVFTFVIGVTAVQTTELAPAIHAGDILIYLRVGTPAGTDLILFDAPAGTAAKTEAGASEAKGDLGNGMCIARIVRTRGVPAAQAEDGVPALREGTAEKIRGTVFMIIRRRPL